MSQDSPIVLIVEDEPDLAELYVEWLDGHCQPAAVHDGDEVFDALDEHVDIVLLDRRMPSLSGDAVLNRIRNQGFECQVAMVTAVTPDFDIIEMGFDDYLVKPVSESELIAMVEGLQLRATYDEQIQELFALASKKVLLDRKKPEAERKASQEYARLEDRLSVLRARVNETVDELLEHDSTRDCSGDIRREVLHNGSS